MAKKKNSTSISDLIQPDLKKRGKRLSPEEINQAADNISQQKEEKIEKSVVDAPERVIEKTPTKRLSVDTPMPLYVKLKTRVAKERLSTREFILRLLEKELGGED